MLEEFTKSDAEGPTPSKRIRVRANRVSNLTPEIDQDIKLPFLNE